MWISGTTKNTPLPPGLQVSSPKGHWYEGSLVGKMTGPNPNPTPDPKPNRNPLTWWLTFSKNKTLNSFSYVHAVRPFRNSD